MLEQRRVGHLEFALVGDQHAQIGVPDEVVQLLRGQRRVQRDGDRAEPPGAVERDEHVDAGGQQDADGVALADPQPAQRAGELEGRVGELLECAPFAAEDQRVVVRPQGSGAVDVVGQGPAGAIGEFVAGHRAAAAR